MRPPATLPNRVTGDPSSTPAATSKGSDRLITAVITRPGGPQCTPAGNPRRSKPVYEPTYRRKAGAGRASILVAVWSSTLVSVRTGALPVDSRHQQWAPASSAMTSFSPRVPDQPWGVTLRHGNERVSHTTSPLSSVET